jgi:hypothetical protein
VTVTKFEQLKELKEMLEQNLIERAEYDKLRADILASRQCDPLRGLPAEPRSDRTTLRSPDNTTTVTLEKWRAFVFGVLFNWIYFAYHGAWLNALLVGVCELIAWILFWPLGVIGWFVTGAFAYRLIVDSYQKRGWTEQPLVTA